MSVSQLGDEADWIETSVLSKSVWDKLKRLTVKSNAVRVGTKDVSGVGLQFLGDLHLDGSSTWNQESLLDEGSDDTEGVMEGSLSLLEHELVGSSNEDGNSLLLGWASSHLDDLLGSTGADLLDEIGMSELLLG